MNHEHDLTIIAGLSGVGKTHLINRIINEEKNFIHFSAGTLIKKRLENVERDSLRELGNDTIIANQFLMVEQMSEEIAQFNSPQKILLDAHMLIDGQDGILEIPYEIFERLAPRRLILLVANAEDIVSRRSLDSSRKRPLRTSNEIAQQQLRSVELARTYCQKMGIPYIEFCSQDIFAILDIIYSQQHTSQD
jgi:adenylate kinase